MNDNSIRGQPPSLAASPDLVVKLPTMPCAAAPMLHKPEKPTMALPSSRRLSMASVLPPTLDRRQSDAGKTLAETAREYQSDFESGTFSPVSKMPQAHATGREAV